MSDPADDPGRFWRRMARLGALIATIVAFYPLGSGYFFAQELYDDLKIIFENDEAALFSPNSPWAILIITACSTTVILCGPVMILSCSASSTKAGIRRAINTAGLIILFPLNALVPFCYVLRMLSGVSDTGRGFGISTMMVYLLLHGFVVLVTMQKRQQPDVPFWPGLTVLGTNLLAWACVVFYGMFYPAGFSQGDWILFFAALSGALSLFLGWLMWWRAVKRAQPSASQSPTEIRNPK